MTICKELDEFKANKIVENLEKDMFWAQFSWDSKTGNITEDLWTGEELFQKFNAKVIWYADKITAWIGGKEHYICEKNKRTDNPDYDNYNPEITSCIWSAYEQGLFGNTPVELNKKSIKPTRN